MTGLSAAIAILAALRERDRTGEAQSIDVGMLDCAVAGMGSMLSAHVNGGLPAARMMLHCSAMTFRNAKGAEVCVAAPLDGEFEGMVRDLPKGSSGQP